MPKTESELKTDFVKKLKATGVWYARRLEDQYAVGLPDMIVGIPFGPTLLIEAKRVEHQSFGPTERQLIELQRWVANANAPNAPYFRLSAIMGFKNGLVYLHQPVPSVTLAECLAQEPGEPPNHTLTRYWKQCLTTEPTR